MAPRVIRPDEVVQVYVAILQLYHPKITITASIRKEGTEYATLRETIYTPTTRLLQMKVVMKLLMYLYMKCSFVIFYKISDSKG